MSWLSFLCPLGSAPHWKRSGILPKAPKAPSPQTWPPHVAPSPKRSSFCHSGGSGTVACLAAKPHDGERFLLVDTQEQIAGLCRGLRLRRVRQDVTFRIAMLLKDEPCAIH